MTHHVLSNPRPRIPSAKMPASSWKSAQAFEQLCLPSLGYLGNCKWKPLLARVPQHSYFSHLRDHHCCLSLTFFLSSPANIAWGHRITIDSNRQWHCRPIKKIKAISRQVIVALVAKSIDCWWFGRILCISLPSPECYLWLQDLCRKQSKDCTRVCSECRPWFCFLSLVRH